MPVYQFQHVPRRPIEGRSGPQSRIACGWPPILRKKYSTESCLEDLNVYSTARPASIGAGHPDRPFSQHQHVHGTSLKRSTTFGKMATKAVTRLRWRRLLTWNPPGQAKGGSDRANLKICLRGPGARDTPRRDSNQMTASPVRHAVTGTTEDKIPVPDHLFVTNRRQVLESISSQANNVVGPFCGPAVPQVSHQAARPILLEK